MKVGIFYLSLDGKAARGAPGKRVPLLLLDSGQVFVRVDIVKAATLEGALALANPFPGEAVMNAYPLDRKDWT
jgi:hypothetical protein